jgi:hypothetical protein
MNRVNNKQPDPFDPILAQAIENSTKRYHFYKALLNLELVVIGTVQDDGQTLHLKYFEVNEGLVLPVFTSLNKFQTLLQPQYPYVKIPAKMLLEMVDSDTPWVLNPGFEPSKKIIQEELQTLKDGRIFHYFYEHLSDMEKEALLTEQMIDFPEESMNLICSTLKQYEAIKKAYFTHLYDPSSTGHPIPLIALELEEGEQAGSELVDILYTTVNQQLQSQAIIEWMVLNEIIPLSHSITTHSKPFYTRQAIDDLRSMFN